MPASRHLSSAAANIHCKSVCDTPMTRAPSSFSPGLAHSMCSLGRLRRDADASAVEPSLFETLAVASEVIDPVIVAACRRRSRESR